MERNGSRVRVNHKRSEPERLTQTQQGEGRVLGPKVREDQRRCSSRLAGVEGDSLGRDWDGRAALCRSSEACPSCQVPRLSSQLSIASSLYGWGNRSRDIKQAPLDIAPLNVAKRGIRSWPWSLLCLCHEMRTSESLARNSTLTMLLSLKLYILLCFMFIFLWSFLWRWKLLLLKKFWFWYFLKLFKNFKLSQQNGEWGCTAG